MSFDLGDYNDVPARMADFKAKHPEGSLQPADPARPFWLEVVEGRTFVCYAAAAYRTPDDPRPGIGTAWEPCPGRTPYTKDSEVQNAETSAWGRAIVAALASETKRVATDEDIRNRREAKEPDPMTDEQQAALADWLDGGLNETQAAELKEWWKAQKLPARPRLNTETAATVLAHLNETYADGPGSSVEHLPVGEEG